MLHKLVKRIAPVALAALGAGLGGCDGMDIEINGEKGVPLAELDMSGDPPSKVVLAGPDRIVLSEGEALSIDVEGDSEVTERLRFWLEDDTLGVSRENGSWKDSGTAIVRVTMPAPRDIVVAGSGEIEAPAMADTADITIAGSGRAEIARIEASKLDVTIAGSGTLSAAGSAEVLDLNIVGSGSADMAALKVDSADINVAGSGDAHFASDGTVEANIMGSGDVRVAGSATCEIKAMGSGTLKCEPASDSAAAAE